MIEDHGCGCAWEVLSLFGAGEVSCAYTIYSTYHTVLRGLMPVMQETS